RRRRCRGWRHRACRAVAPTAPSAGRPPRERPRRPAPPPAPVPVRRRGGRARTRRAGPGPLPGDGRRGVPRGPLPRQPDLPGCDPARGPRPGRRGRAPGGRALRRIAPPLRWRRRRPVPSPGDAGRRDHAGGRLGASLGTGRLGGGSRHGRRTAVLPGPVVLRARPVCHDDHVTPADPAPRPPADTSSAGAAPTPPADPADLDAAVEIVRAAGEVTLRWFAATDLVVDSKADGTPVTAADRAAERRVREMLGERFPDDGVLGEEEPETPGRSGRRWIVDPIDGTKAFTRAVPLYSTLLALEDEHGPAVGVIGLPALGQVVYAGRGLGCFADGRPARVSGTTTLDGAYLMSSSYSHW